MTLLIMKNSRIQEELKNNSIIKSLIFFYIF